MKILILSDEKGCGNVGTYVIEPAEPGMDNAPYNKCVEFPEYYEVAKYSWYIRVDKNTLKVTTNLHSVNEYQTSPSIIATIEEIYDEKA